MNTILNVLVFAVVAFSSLAQAEGDGVVRLFSCAKPVSLFDPSFQQGDEIYAYVSVKNDAQAELVYVSGTSGLVTLFNYEQTSFYGVHLENSSIVFTWTGGSYFSAMYLGSQWGAVLKIESPHTADGVYFSPGTEMEFYCSESEYFKTIP